MIEQCKKACEAFVLCLLMIPCTSALRAQESQADQWANPLGMPLVLSGNFGELRANHFHGGLDFKTGGVSGKPVYALGEGYISRVAVTHGSGYVLEICYNNGFTTICRHLSRFKGPLAARIKSMQYEKESYEVELIPEVGEYPVEKGEQIAWSGNTGYSMGPHLHLDVIDNETGEHVDGIPFFKKYMTDYIAPKVINFKLYPRLGEGAVRGASVPYAFKPGAEPVTAWGWIAAGLKAYDYMENVSNKYGVHTVELKVDGEFVFRSVIDRFDPEEHRYINSWSDKGYMKSYIDPGNQLRMLEAADNQNGWILIDEERDYRFTYHLVDAFGNDSNYSFTVRGKKQPIVPARTKNKFFMAWDKVNYLQEPGLTLVVPQGRLYDDAYLDYELDKDTSNVAYTYQLSKHNIPLHRSCALRIGIIDMPVEDTDKYYVAKKTSKGYSGIGGVYENGAMTAQIRELGTFTVKVDTVPPKIVPVNKAKWTVLRKITFKVSDLQTGISYYQGRIDGKYALFGRHNMTRSIYEYTIDTEKLPKEGRMHKLVFTAVDGCGNKSSVEESFVW